METSEAIEVTFTLASADLRAFQRRHLLRSVPLLWAWIAISLVLIFASNLFQAPLFYWFLDLGVPEDVAYALVGWMPFGLMLLIFAGMIVYSRHRDKAKGKTRLAYLEQHVVVSPAGMHVERDGITVDFAWRRASKLRSRKKVLDIYLDDRQAFVVPARAFSSEDAFMLFTRQVQQYFDTAHPAKI